MSRDDTRAESLKKIYGENCEKYTDIEYRHPESEKLLIGIKAILSECETGRHLLAVSNKLNLSMYLIKHDKIKGNALDGKLIILSAPETKTSIEPMMVMELAAALREAEQEAIGYCHPGENADPLEFAAMSHAKNLDIIVHMCRIALELSQNSNEKKYIEALEEEGLGGIYDAYVRDFSSDDIVEKYYES
jgi:hypothetical protein